MTRPRRRQRSGSGAEQPDRISDLPTDLLIEILGGVQCARTAAAAGLASRRFLGLWPLLPEIYLLDVPPSSIDAALAQLEAAREEAGAAAPAVLHIATSRGGAASCDVASCLRRAARLAPAELKVSFFTGPAVVFAVHSNRRRMTRTAAADVHLPCFDRTVSIEIELLPASEPCRLVVPGGKFRKLERLVLKGCHLDVSALIPRCPALRVLEIWHSSEGLELPPPPHTIHSASLEELVVVESSRLARRVDIVAPALKHLFLTADMASLSLSAPNLDKLSLNARRIDS
ncbi:hypothetical protein QOZ80_8BG0643680 [Eleusine coracana subsp. coracana]|nr:hypothetical protein QOZ80_8BG0643680 [Eleusine coracana subsp. coracana]